MAQKITYQEPVDYIPESVRKKLGLGEYSPAAKESDSKSSAKTPAKSTTKKSK